MINTTRCPKCGAELLSESKGGFCAACLLESGLKGLQQETASELSKTRVDETPGRLERGGSESPLRSFGDYELLSEIARGGQGVVYRARQKSLHRLVALKMIALGPWATDAHLKRFRIEAEAAANLDHPQIVPIYEIGQIDGQHYFTMRLIEGTSLKRAVADRPLPPRQAASIVAAVARAIHHAHQRGILHRDIKPGNILLDEEDQPHVTDFGLAKLVEAESTVTNTMDVLGTPSYMSPEAAAGKSREMTPTTDVYGLGAVLYELLTGNPPFAGGTTLETIRQVMEKEPRRPRLWNPKLDRDIETICLKCLEKDPAKRYPSCEHLAEDLERWRRHEPIRARPGGVVSHAAKWLRRNPATAVSIATVAALGAAIGVIIWQRVSKAGGDAGQGKSLAVVLRAADPSAALLAQEFSRNVNHLLNGLSGLRVLERSQVLKWEASKEPLEKIGKALGTTAVWLGELRTVIDTVHLNFELVTFPGGGRLLTRTLTNSIADLTYLPSRIAREVVNQLGVSRTEAEQARLRRPLSTNQAAFFAYLNGRQFLEVLDENLLKKAMRHFGDAIRYDTNFAQAYAGMAQVFINIGYNFSDPELGFAQARSLVNAALALDDSLPEAKIADGLLKFYYEWDWEGARKALDEAMRLDPSVLEANACFLHSLDVFGKGKEALKRVRQAALAHPGSPAIQLELGCAAYYAGDYNDALEFLRTSLQLNPENPFVYWNVARTLVQKGDYANALANLKIAKSKPDGEASVIDAEIAYIHGRQGETDEARRIIANLHTRERGGEFIEPYLYAVSYAGLGETNKVFEYLNLACDKRSTYISSLIVEPKFDGLRNDPAYQRILVRLKLPAKREHAAK